MSIFSNFLFPISVLVFRWQLPHSAALLRKRPSRRNSYSLICGEFQLSRVYVKPHFILKKKALKTAAQLINIWRCVNEDEKKRPRFYFGMKMQTEDAAKVWIEMQLKVFLKRLKRGFRHVECLLVVNVRKAWSVKILPLQWGFQEIAHNTDVQVKPDLTPVEK